MAKKYRLSVLVDGDDLSILSDLLRERGTEFEAREVETKTRKKRAYSRQTKTPGGETARDVVEKALATFPPNREVPYETIQKKMVDSGFGATTASTHLAVLIAEKKVEKIGRGNYRRVA